jgi:hypothetical protein
MIDTDGISDTVEQYIPFLNILYFYILSWHVVPFHILFLGYLSSESTFISCE